MVAISKNNVIGNKGMLPWHYKEDLAYFKEVTMGHSVLMGRKTFDSIVHKLGRPLPGRCNVVVTNNRSFAYPGVRVVWDLEQYLQENKDSNEVIFIIGGAEIFDKTIRFCDKLFVTHIDKEYPGDVFLPEIDFRQYQLESKRESGILSFCVYKKVNV